MQITFTKRSLLRVSSKIFDPFGLVSPFVIKLKLMFQNLCIEGGDWDNPITGEMSDQWELNELNALKFQGTIARKMI